MKVATVFTLLAGASATDCSPGFKHKKDLTNLKCKSASTTATLQGDDNCNNICCEADAKTCGGLGAAAITCATPAKYYVPAAGTDAWKSTATTAANAGKDCCIAKATCGGSSYECQAGFEKDNNKAADACTTDAKSCGDAGSVCCKPATDQCEVAKDPANAANPLTDATCGSPQYILGSTLCGTDTACKEAWGKTTFATGKQKEACCSVAPTCFGLKGSLTCDAGKKFNPALTATPDKALTGGVMTSAVFNTDCCIKDTDTCLGIEATVTCPSGSFKDTSLNGRSIKGLTTAAQKNARCCSAAAKCSNSVCPKGYKAKASAASTSCGGLASKCTLATCCEADLTTCGGNFPATPIACATGFYDERTFWKSQADEDGAPAGSNIKATPQAVKDAWNLKNTSAATKTTDCCSPVTNCTNITAAALAAAGITTTPAAVVTTTPQPAPALKYSEHKIAIEKSSGSNMVWLGVGAFMGMGVLMFVQHVRSERSRRMMVSSEESLE